MPHPFYDHINDFNVCFYTLNYNKTIHFLKQRDIDFYTRFLDYISDFHQNNKQTYFKKQNTSFFFKILDFIVNYIHNNKELNDNSNNFYNLYLNNIIHLRGVLVFLKKNTFLEHLINKEDEHGFSPLLDCARYGSYHTFLYLLKKTCNMFVATETMLQFSMMNSDSRIFGYIYNGKPIIGNHLTKKTNLIYVKENITCLITVGNTGRLENYTNLYKRINRVIQYIGDKTIINYILNTHFYITNTKFYRKLVKKYSDVLEFSKLNKFIYCNYRQVPIIYSNLKSKYDIKNIVELLKVICSKFEDNLEIINDIYINYKNYITEEDYFEIYYNFFRDNINYLSIQNNIQLNLFFNFIRPNIINNDKLCKFLYNKDHIVIYTTLDSGSIDYVYRYGFSDTIPFINNQYYTFFKNTPNVMIMKWTKTIETIQKCIQTRFKLKPDVIVYDKIVQTLNYDFDFKKKYSYKNTTPIQITMKHIFYMDQNLYITEKADGIRKELPISGMYPKINFFDINDILGIPKIYGEEMIIDNTTILFVFGNRDIINYLRNVHPYIDNSISDCFSIDNEHYRSTEIRQLDLYISKNKTKKRYLWWPKKVWTISKQLFIDNYPIIKQHTYNIFKTDGWIITDVNKLYKIKPDHKLSIDLMYNNGEFYYDRFIKFKNINISHTYTNSKIYRCYYNEQTKIWVPHEERTDKTVPNNKLIIKHIVNYFEHKWDISDVTSILEHNQYYQLNNRRFFINNNNKLINTILKQYCLDKTVFDIGCGFVSDKIITLTKCSNYTGIDINTKIKINGVNKTQKKLHIININGCWETQLNKMNEELYPINYDVFLLINTIHFCYKNIGQFFINIKKIRKQNTTIIVKFLNRDLLDHFGELVTYDTNFVKRLPNNMIKYYYSHVHNVPQTEYVFSEKEITDIFYTHLFELKDVFHFYKKNDISWENYLNCFSVLVFRSVL